MKKLLMIAVLSLFAMSAFALEAGFYGEYELGGRFINNVSLGEDSDTYPSENAAFLKHYFVLGADMTIDNVVTIGARTTAADRRFGFTGADLSPIYGDDGVTVIDHLRVDNPDGLNIELDRAWARYNIMPGLSLTGGRYDGGNYEHMGFGTGWYDGYFEEMGGRDLLRVDYKANDDIALFFVAEKYTESSIGLDVGSNVGGQLGDKANGRDTDAYILGADMTFGDMIVLPRLAYSTGYDPRYATLTDSEPRANLMSAYVGFGLNPAMGFNVNAALAFITGGSNGSWPMTNINSDGTDYEDYTAFGAFVEPTFVAEDFTVGLTLAYASYDKDSGYFEFGGDFDRTIIMDTEFLWSYGVPAMTTAQLFLDYKINDFTISPRIAYYMSNTDWAWDDMKDGVKDNGVAAMFGGFVITEDTNVIELDLVGHYQWTETTGITAGIAYAMINDISYNGAEQYSPDGVMTLLWDIYTAF